jgi:transposase InsO family protein
LYEATHDVGLVCRRCGISGPTLRTWLRRYEAYGEAGLVAQSRRPKTCPRGKGFEPEEAWIVELRRERKFGARRIQQELRRQQHVHRGLEAIPLVLKRHEAPPLRRPKRPQPPIRYNAAWPGERVQMDTMKLAPGLYQYTFIYTFIDDCRRYLVAALSSRRTAANTLDFLKQLFAAIPFPIQRLQTDNGTEFMAYKVRDELLAMCITHRPIPPRMPHLHGKVERVQQTMLTEFSATTTFDSPSQSQSVPVSPSQSQSGGGSGHLATGLQLSPHPRLARQNADAALERAQ